MNANWEILYQYDPDYPHTAGLIILRPSSAKAKAGKPTHRNQREMNFATTKGSWLSGLGIALVAISLGGMLGPLIPTMRLEAAYWSSQARVAMKPPKVQSVNALPANVPTIFNPLVTPDGSSIDPVNTEFSVIVPKVGINAPVVANVDPSDTQKYLEVLKTSVAHAGTSFTPDEEGTTYLFSHSTNFDWFVRDVNAVFYLLKNLEEGDTIVVLYKGTRYTYRLTGKKVVSPTDVSYLVPETGKKRLILQTCWPPGSTTERLLIFADLVEEGERI